MRVSSRSGCSVPGAAGAAASHNGLGRLYWRVRAYVRTFSEAPEFPTNPGLRPRAADCAYAYAMYACLCKRSPFVTSPRGVLTYRAPRSVKRWQHRPAVTPEYRLPTARQYKQRQTHTTMQGPFLVVFRILTHTHTRSRRRVRLG